MTRGRISLPAGRENTAEGYFSAARQKRSFPGLTLTLLLARDNRYFELGGLDVICNESDLCGILNEICKVISDSQIRTQRQDAMLLHQ